MRTIISCRFRVQDLRFIPRILIQECIFQPQEGAAMFTCWYRVQGEWQLAASRRTVRVMRSHSPGRWARVFPPERLASTRGVNQAAQDGICQMCIVDSRWLSSSGGRLLPSLTILQVGESRRGWRRRRKFKRKYEAEVSFSATYFGAIHMALGQNIGVWIRPLYATRSIPRSIPYGSRPRFRSRPPDPYP